MDYQNGRLNGLPYITYLEKKEDSQSHQSSVVLIDKSEGSINERFGLQLTSGTSQNLTQ